MWLPRECQAGNPNRQHDSVVELVLANLLSDSRGVLSWYPKVIFTGLHAVLLFWQNRMC